MTYPHRYKNGKITEVMKLKQFKNRVQNRPLFTSLEQIAYIVLLWHTGVRKSEAYELTRDKVTVTPDYVIVDFGQRKKHGGKPPALKIPRTFYGIEEYFIPYLNSIAERRHPELFPMIGSTTAWKLAKHILGPDYYPHYFRLRKLTAAGRTAKNYPDMIAAVKSISGLKTLDAISAYLGSDEEVRKRAMEGSE